MLRRLAKRLFKRCETYNPYILADCMEITYKYVDMNEKMLGLTVVFDREPIILLNSALAESNKRYEVMAHELSHALCHADLPITYGFMVNGKIKLEGQADDFAAHILTGFYAQEFGHQPNSFDDLRKTFMIDEGLIGYYV
jgi:Zn-dependent peptidase ImmA (M78 family)